MTDWVDFHSTGWAQAKGSEFTELGNMDDSETFETQECAFGSLLLALFDTHSLTLLRTLGQILFYQIEIFATSDIPAYQAEFPP